MQPKQRAAKAYQLQVSSGEDTNAEDIGTPQTKITETSLQKDSNANK